MSQLFTPGGQSIGVSASAISPSSEHPGLIYFRMDWLDLLAVQETLKSLIQHHSSTVSILQRSAFFTVQLSHPYMTTGKTIALTRRTFVDKVISLSLCHCLSLAPCLFFPCVSFSNSLSLLILRYQLHLIKAMVFPVVMYGLKLDCEESCVPKN